ncbi:IAP-3 [Rachiplusia nu nucleopolyhedrovirus]|uniref:IAP-3 n=1 Tax=Rachiplusia nu nucleopolyhedrovirus TaxID=2605775 RepID=A0AAE6IQQ6_9ABAC|nr:IAP-3 [Rachiplusia nu nucleopolyhedrovirus]QEI03658.1 IAP-3 [Rachiplusia nu nucleopolyhedrovirus]
MPNLCTYELAINGFYRVPKTKTRARCVFCKIEIAQWDMGENNIDEIHSKWAPQCPFVRGELEEESNEMLYKTYKHYQNRLESFSMYQTIFETDHISNIPMRKFAEAGFFYTGVDDEVKCYLCFLGINKWESTDVPIELHRTNNPQCPVVVNYFKKYSNTPETSLIEDQNSASVFYDEADNASLADEAPLASPKRCCIICCGRDINCCYFPCAHAVTCMRCARKTEICPMCRSKYEFVMKLYF